MKPQPKILCWITAVAHNACVCMNARNRSPSCSQAYFTWCSHRNWLRFKIIFFAPHYTVSVCSIQKRKKGEKQVLSLILSTAVSLKTTQHLAHIIQEEESLRIILYNRGKERLQIEKARPGEEQQKSSIRWAARYTRNEFVCVLNERGRDVEQAEGNAPRRNGQALC